MGTLVLAKGVNIQLSDNFSSKEMDCKCKKRFCTGTLVNQEIIKIAQQIRNEFGGPLKVVSGFRCGKHNKKKSVGGGSQSQHLAGNAMDLNPRNGDVKKLYEIAAKIISDGKGGMGKYNSFVHIDSRVGVTSGARWNG